MKACCREVKSCEVGIDVHRSTKSQGVALRQPAISNIHLGLGITAVQTLPTSQLKK
jgi:hypothetical protein